MKAISPYQHIITTNLLRDLDNIYASNSQVPLIGYGQRIRIIHMS